MGLVILKKQGAKDGAVDMSRNSCIVGVEACTWAGGLIHDCGMEDCMVFCGVMAQLSHMGFVG